MDGEPQGADLLEAAEGALRELVMPALSGEARYQAAMAASAVAMVARELREGTALANAREAAQARLGPDGIGALRAGRYDADPSIHEVLHIMSIAATAITRPGALDEEERRRIGVRGRDGN